MNVKIGVSARHVHLKEDDFYKLFGEGSSLTKRNDLTQTGEFASEQLVSIKTSKGTIDKVRILGPLRNYTQVEISKTDSYKLGINPPVRNSGDLDNSEEVIICGPNGEIVASNSTIIAARHIHINHDDRVRLGLVDTDVVKVKFDGVKGGILDSVYIKENDNYVYEMHIDVDDANAFMISNGDIGEIIK